MNNQRKTIPWSVMLIAGFYIFGALVLLAFLFINPDQVASAIAQRHGLPASTGSWILPVVAGLALVISYGLFSLSRWGYWLAILYSIYIAVVNLTLYRTQADLLFFGNLLWSVIVIIVLFLVRRRFYGTPGAARMQSQNV